MISPTPRPALRKAPDANIHPAEPVQARDWEPAANPRATGSAKPTSGAKPSGGATATTMANPRVIRLPGVEQSAPTRGKRLTGTTSDTLRTVKHGRQDLPTKREPAKEKRVDLGVQVPKSLRKDLRAAAKSAGRTPDEVVASLIRAWIDN